MMLPAATLLLVLSARTVTLDEAERAAVAQRPDIRQADANVAAGLARNEEARAPLLPQVKIEGLYERTTGNRPQKPGHTNNYGNTFDTFNWYDGQASINQLLWDFGQAPNRWRAAKARAVALGDTARATRLQAIADVRTAYFRADAQKSLVAVARQTLGNRQRHLEQIRGFVHAGTRPDIDLAQAIADEANARVQVIRSENNYAVARAELNQAMGTTGDTDYDVADATLPPQPGEASGVGALIDEAIRARPDLAAMVAQIRAQELTVKATRDSYWPTLSAVAGAETAGQSFEKSHILDNFGQVRAVRRDGLEHLRRRADSPGTCFRASSPTGSCTRPTPRSTGCTHSTTRSFNRSGWRSSRRCSGCALRWRRWSPRARR